VTLSRSRTPAVAGALAVLTLLAAPARAGAQTQIATRAAFNALAFPPYAYPFTAPDGNLVTILSSAQGDLARVTTVGGNDYGLVQGGALGGASSGAVDNFRPLRFDFLQPVFAFAFDDLDLTAGDGVPTEWAIVDVTLLGGATTRYTLGVTTAFSPAFFGVVSATALQRVEIFSAGTLVNPQPNTRANLLDNVAIGVGPSSTVPEPATLTLTASGLLALGALAHRRRRG
jgi:hypothetical protein